MAEAIGLLQAAEEQDRVSAGKGASSGRIDAISDTDAVDRAVEGLFLRALELEATHRWALNNLGLHLHARSRNDEVRDGRRHTQQHRKNQGCLVKGIDVLPWIQLHYCVAAVHLWVRQHSE